MIDFVPLHEYYNIFIHFCAFLVLANLAHAYTLDFDNVKNIKFLRTSGWVLFILVVLYLGLRPISGVFGDMGTYSIYFRRYAAGGPVTLEKDIVFNYYMKFLSGLVPIHGFFLVTEFLYITPMLLIAKRYFKHLWFYVFFMFIISFSFYTYGTNGIRNGLATSLFLWGLCFRKKKIIMGLFFLIAVLFHKTLTLPIMAFVVTYFYNDAKVYLKFWLLSIPLSLFLGSAFILLFTSLGFGDDRLAGYLTSKADTKAFSSTGFRWDFLFYSSFPVVTGWYFIIKKNFKDQFYTQVYNTYLICNMFWILVIRANFSNRFAYLSWFIMGFIIIYPFLKQRFFKNQIIVTAKVITAYFMFTYLMFILYY
jgi:hypothetical protein